MDQLRILLLIGLRARNYANDDVAIISGKVFRAYPEVPSTDHEPADGMAQHEKHGVHLSALSSAASVASTSASVV